MTLSQKLIEISKDMPENLLAEVIDYAEYIKYKNLKEQKELVDKFIKENDVALKELAK